jgi:hypothetical protein
VQNDITTSEDTKVNKTQYMYSTFFNKLQQANKFNREDNLKGTNSIISTLYIEDDK